MIQLIKRTNAKERLLVLASVLFIVGQVWMDLKVPDYMSQITTLLQTPNTAISEILKPGGWMILLSLMSFVFSSIVGLFAASLTCRLRQEMFGQVMDYSTYEIQQFSIPSLTPLSCAMSASSLNTFPNSANASSTGFPSHAPANVLT